MGKNARALFTAMLQQDDNNTKDKNNVETPDMEF